MNLVDKYLQLMEKFSFLELYKNNRYLEKQIAEMLKSFCTNCQTPAIWCNGKHTRMLMGDFIFELKKVRYIVDKDAENQRNSGFSIIGSEKIEECKIDGIIISSFKYRNEIKEILKLKYPKIKYLDIYEKLAERGVVLDVSYWNSPLNAYTYYKNINRLRKEIRLNGNQESILQQMINAYLNVKDFDSTICCIDQLIVSFDKEEYRCLKNEVVDLYQLELDTIKNSSKENVIMICVDGLRRQDVLGKKMPKMKEILQKETALYSNAYSVSTSTFESLIPAYSENKDLKSKYFESNCLKESQCRFIKKAIEQDRKIYFYTDDIQYIESNNIRIMEEQHNVTDKIWRFAVDVANEHNGLFYIHVLNESHYSYVNPYTEDELLAEGTSIMFDYLDKLGGKLRTDYELQQKDALRFLDQILTPVIEKIPGRMVLYADHGNVMFSKDTKLEEIKSSKFSYDEDLIQIPIAIKSPDCQKSNNKQLLSLMCINDIVCSLLCKTKFEPQNQKYIKIQRSTIYNCDFKYVYHKAGMCRELKAFECFIFKDNYKIIIYEDGEVLLCNRSDDIIDDKEKAKELLNLIRKEVTVVDSNILEKYVV